MVNGIEGFLADNIIDLDDYLSDENNYELLKRTPSAFLGSCRYKLPKFEDDPDTYKKIFEILEKHHEERFRKLLKNIEDEVVFPKDEDTIWICRNCGHVVVGKKAPKVCPVCAHPQSYFEIKSNNY